MFIIPTYIYIHKHEETGTGRDTKEGGEKMGGGGGGGGGGRKRPSARSGVLWPFALEY